MDDVLDKKLVIPSRPADAHAAQQAIMKEVEQHGFTGEVGFAVRLSLDEALSNAIRHGNDQDPKKMITVDYSVTKDHVRIRVSDEGAGFDPNHLPDPTQNENLEKPHGRGVILMRAYMTEVRFSNRGNSVTMVKDRDCQLPLRS